VLQKTRASRPEQVSRVMLWGMGIEDLGCLCLFVELQVVSLTDNRVSSLQVFRGLPKLEELYLRRNRLADAAELDALAGLRLLRRLWVAENPFCLGLQDYRLSVLRRLPQLAMLDEALVSPEERKLAAAGAPGRRVEARPESGADRDAQAGHKLVFKNAGLNFLEELKLDSRPDTPAQPREERPKANRWLAPDRHRFPKPPVQPAPRKPQPGHADSEDALDRYRHQAEKPPRRDASPSPRNRGWPHPRDCLEAPGERAGGTGLAQDEQYRDLFYSSMLPERDASSGKPLRRPV